MRDRTMRIGCWSCLPLLAACWSSHAEISDADPADRPIPADGAETDTGRDDGDGADDDAGILPDAEAAADVPDEALLGCPEGWYDPSSDLCWEAVETFFGDWYEAIARCEALTLGDHPAGTWRLPSVSEWRSLFRGCPPTETGGACAVTDACLAEGCLSSACDGCPPAGSLEGCYCDPAVRGGCSAYWAASPHVDDAANAWFASLGTARLHHCHRTYAMPVRCVRTGH